MRFKVGDKVRVKSSLKAGEMYDNCYCSGSMSKYAGSVAEVVLIDEEEGEETYRLRFENEEWAEDWQWAWVDLMLDPAEEQKRPYFEISFESVDKQKVFDVIRKSFEELAGVESSDEPDELPDDEPDMIQKPPHYNKFSFQPIDVITEVANYYEGSTAFHIGTVLKYLCRAPFKGKLLEDLKKANYYLTRAIDEMEEDGE